MIAFLSVRLAMPNVLAAAAVNADLTSGRPAPGARLLRTKRVKCFLAAVAISSCPPGNGVTAAKIAGDTLAHCAGIYIHLENLYAGMENKGVVKNLITICQLCPLMSNSKVHRVKDQKKVVTHYKVIPYGELLEILKQDGIAFFEDTKEEPLKRQTVHAAARRLSGMVKQKVVARRSLLELENGRSLEGYLFRLDNTNKPAKASSHG